MIDQVLNLAVTAVEAVISWWSAIMGKTGGGTLYIVIMSVVLSVSILLGPLLGSLRSGLSDVVHRPRNGGDK